MQVTLGLNTSKDSTYELKFIKTICLINYDRLRAIERNNGPLVWRFIDKYWSRPLGISVWSTCARGDSPSRPGLTTCWGKTPTFGRIGSRAKTDPTPVTLNRRSHMTLIKSIKLGSAAGIVAIASAEAADLPTRKAAPVEYVRVCNVGASPAGPCRAPTPA